VSIKSNRGITENAKAKMFIKLMIQWSMAMEFILRLMAKAFEILDARHG